MMRRSLVFACLAAASVAPGCITYIQGDVYKHPDWAAARGRLGKVVIAPPRSASPEVAREAERLARESLAALGGLEVADRERFLEELGRPPETVPVGEAEAVAAARKLGIDTVCLLTLGAYGGRLMAGLLPQPFWYMETEVTYGMRILDASSGKILLETVRSRKKGGPFAIRTPGQVPGELSRDLADILGPAEEEVTRSAGPPEGDQPLTSAFVSGEGR